MKVIVGPTIYTQFGSGPPICINPNLVRMVRPFKDGDNTGTEIVFSETHSVRVISDFDRVMRDFAAFFGRITDSDERTP